jgi:2-keto-4-pentenoate hydratase/2-oxohepta-3-ene-1,7-dioic acid hydratase in catechol pathway
LRLLTYKYNHVEAVGALISDDRILPVETLTVLSAGQELLKSGHTMLDIIRGGEPVLAALREALDQSNGQEVALLEISEVELLAPIPRPPKIIAIGLNYMDHCRETGTQPPSRPLLFAKFPTSVTSHNALITWTKGVTTEVDYEAELAVIIGKTAKKVRAAEAFDKIFAYTALNDVSARDMQFGDKQWVRGKSLDTFCPMGPVLVTKDQLPEPNNIQIGCRVNGHTLQNSNTREMIFKVPELIEYITQDITLEPGDVIATGTPSGVGFSRVPPVYLKHGDEVEVFIEGIGSLVNHVRVTASSEL